MSRLNLGRERQAGQGPGLTSSAQRGEGSPARKVLLQVASGFAAGLGGVLSPAPIPVSPPTGLSGPVSFGLTGWAVKWDLHLFLTFGLPPGVFSASLREVTVPWAPLGGVKFR